MIRFLTRSGDVLQNPAPGAVRRSLGLTFLPKLSARSSTADIFVAEWEFGVGRGVNSLVCLIVGTGTGAGMILNGSLFRGYSHAAGEIGWLLHNESLQIALASGYMENYLWSRGFSCRNLASER